MTLSGAFLQALSLDVHSSRVVPSVLCRAAANVLPVDATGLSTLIGPLRMPLGASSSEAQTAEEIQTSLGSGPCLAVAETEAGLVADWDELAERWPMYGAELVENTPFRSAASVPLRNAKGSIFAALDLYAEVPDLSSRLDLEAVSQDVAPLVAALLWPRVVEIPGVDEVQPAWYAKTSARRREVWVAVGMVMGELHCSEDQAIGRLRAYAYSHNLTLDDLSEDLTTDRLTVGKLID